MLARQGFLLFALATVLTLLAAAGCANRSEPLPTPTIGASALTPNAATARTPTLATPMPEPTPTREARATPESAGDASVATAATPEPTAVGGGSTDTFHFRGPADAPVTVAEFADFQ